MCPAVLHLLPIKDLKDLSVFFVGGSIDMQDLKDLKRFFHGRDHGGQAPALRGKNGVRYRRARACPSPSSAESNARGGQATALRGNRDREVSPTGEADVYICPS